jgi:hypothetical protein
VGNKTSIFIFTVHNSFYIGKIDEERTGLFQRQVILFLSFIKIRSGIREKSAGY